MTETDPGLRVPVMWNVSGELVDAVKAGALGLRSKRERIAKRDRIIFRASELGNVLAVRDAKGNPSGCALKPFFRFHEDRYPRRMISAEAALNFAKGENEEDKMASYLAESGLLVEQQVPFGAWAECNDPDECARSLEHPRAEPTCGVPGYVHADPRFPDRSGGLARGKCDFIIDASRIDPKLPKRVPLEFKSASSWSYGYIPEEGPKTEHSLQGAFYAHEEQSTHFAVGYTDKESGDIIILLCRSLPKVWWKKAWARARALREAIERDERPPMPEGVGPARPDENRTMRNGWNTYRIPEAYYHKGWPCYVFGTKKGRVTACEWYRHCHGEELPEKPAHDPPLIPRAKKKTGAKKPPRKVGKKGGFTVVRE